MKYDTKRYTLIWYYDIDRGLGSETFFIWHSSDLLILYEPDGSPLSVGLNYYRGAVWGLNTTRSCQGWEAVVFERVDETIAAW